MSILLSVRDLTAGYGGVPIIEGIGLDVAEHEIAVIIGPNGAGKSTLLKSIFALTRVTAGTITFAGRDITHARTPDLVPMGIAAVPQSRNVFPTLTVAENLDVGTYAAPPADKSAVAGAGSSAFPRPGRKAAPAGGRAFGRPASDGGDWPGADERTPAPPAR